MGLIKGTRNIQTIDFGPWIQFSIWYTPRSFKSISYCMCVFMHFTLRGFKIAHMNKSITIVFNQLYHMEVLLPYCNIIQNSICLLDRNNFLYGFICFDWSGFYIMCILSRCVNMQNLDLKAAKMTVLFSFYWYMVWYPLILFSPRFLNCRVDFKVDLFLISNSNIIIIIYIHITSG